MNSVPGAKSSELSVFAMALSEGAEVHVIRPHNGSKPRLLDRAALQKVCGWIVSFSLWFYLMAQLLNLIYTHVASTCMCHLHPIYTLPSRPINIGDTDTSFPT